MNLPSRPIKIILVGMFVAAMAFAATANGAQPSPGPFGYSLTYGIPGNPPNVQRINFRVVQKGDKPAKVTKLVVSHTACGGAFKVPGALNVGRDGKFEFDGDVESVGGGEKMSVDVTGKFVSKGKATGEVGLGGCPLLSFDFIAKKGGNDQTN